MQNEKNVVMCEVMSKNQLSPGLCDPRDFEVIEAGESATISTPFHGQCGSTDAEYQKLLQQGEVAANASNFSERGEEHPNVNTAGKPRTPAGRDEE